MMIDKIFSLGYRCNSTQFIREYKIWGISSPFDWIMIDFETAIKNISDGFKHFLSDIVVYKKLSYKAICYSTQPIKPFFNELDKLNITYMRQNLNELVIRLNQNYLPSNITGNIYEWDRICYFLHYNMEHEEEYNKILRRVKEFKDIYKNHPDDMLLFHISKIIESKNLDEIKQQHKNIIKEHKITCPIFMVLTVANGTKTELEIDDNIYLFTLPVPSYEQQFPIIDAENMLGVINHKEIYKILTNEFTIKKVPNPNVEPV